MSWLVMCIWITVECCMTGYIYIYIFCIVCVCLMLCGSCLSMFRSMYEVGCSVCACVQGILTLCVCSRDSNSVCVCVVCGGGCVHVCLQSFSRWCRYRPAIPNLFGSRAQFCGRQIFHRHGGGMISGWFKCIMFIVHFISIVITSVPPQRIRH